MRTIAALLLFSGVLLAQQATRQTWEYASVTAYLTSTERTGRSDFDAWVGRATICFAVTEGCRTENVTVTTRETTQAGELALMKAAATLGEQGWELTAATEWQDQNSGGNPVRIRYVFRRPQSN